MADTIRFQGTRPAVQNALSVGAGWDVTLSGEINGASFEQVYFVYGTAATAPVLVSDLANMSYQDSVQNTKRVQVQLAAAGKLVFTCTYENLVCIGATPGGDPGWFGIVVSTSNPTGTDAFVVVSGPIDVVAD